MFNVYKALGIQEIYKNEELMQKLQASILDEVRYLIPGYSCDYYLRTFCVEVDFELCKDINGNVVGIDPHVSGSIIKSLNYERTIADNGSIRVFSVYDSDRHISFPVRVICPDVLAYPQEGDRIRGQLIALADDRVTISKTPYQEEFTVIDCDNIVRLTGQIKKVEEYEFNFEGITVEYWDMELETVIGKLAIIVRKDVIENPSEGMYITAEAVLSFDLGVGQGEAPSEQYYDEIYEHAAFSSEYEFIPT